MPSSFINVQSLKRQTWKSTQQFFFYGFDWQSPKPEFSDSEGVERYQHKDTGADETTTDNQQATLVWSSSFLISDKYLFPLALTLQHMQSGCEFAA